MSNNGPQTTLDHIMVVYRTRLTQNYILAGRGELFGGLANTRDNADRARHNGTNIIPRIILDDNYYDNLSTNQPPARLEA